MSKKPKTTDRKQKDRLIISVLLHSAEEVDGLMSYILEEDIETLHEEVPKIRDTLRAGYVIASGGEDPWADDE